MEAERELRQRRINAPLTGDALYHLVWQQTGDRERAERALCEFRRQQLLAGITPE